MNTDQQRDRVLQAIRITVAKLQSNHLKAINKFHIVKNEFVLILDCEGAKGWKLGSKLGLDLTFGLRISQSEYCKRRILGISRP